VELKEPADGLTESASLPPAARKRLAVPREVRALAIILTVLCRY